MGNVIAILKLVAVLLPMLVDLIKAVESALPVSGQGRAKAKMVEDMMRSAFATVQGITVTFDQVWPMLQPTIATIVAAYNASGIFKTVAPAPAVAIGTGPYVSTTEPNVSYAKDFTDSTAQKVAVDNHIVG